MSGLQSERSSVLSAALGRRSFRLAASITALALGFTLLQVAEARIAPAAAATEAPAPAPVESAPDAISARLAAARQGTPVEIEDARTERTTTWVLPNGAKQVEAHAADIRVIKDGEWSPISTDLEESGDSLVPEATRATVEIASAGDTDAPLARVSQDGTSLALDWRTDLPDAQVDGSTASFEVPGPEQVEITATNDGFNLRVRLDQAPAKAPVYRLPITTEGLTVRKQSDGSFAGVDKDGAIKVVIDVPVMWDSDPATMDEGWQSHRVPVDATVVTVDGKQELQLRPAMSWLSDPARIYPVWVDPDVATQLDMRDGYVREGLPDNSAASSPTLEVGWGGSSIMRQRAYIQHQLPVLPAGSVVTGGKLTLYQRNAYTCTPKTINAYPVSELWYGSVTWNTKPTYNNSTEYKSSASFNTGLEPTCANGRQDIDLTAMAKAWYGTTSPQLAYYGVMLSNDSGTDTLKSFCSFNVDPNHTSCWYPTRVPKLTITYDAPPENPRNLVASPAATCTTGSGRPFINSTTPVLNGSAAHTDGIPTRLNVAVRTIDGTSTLVGGSTPYVPAGAMTSWQVPAGWLTDGNTYRWRARGDDGTQLSPSTTSWCEFTIDTTAPGAPSISSTAYPANGWAGGAGTAGTFTLTPGTDTGGSGISAVQWALDGGVPTTVATTGSAVNVSITPSTDGKHVLSVYTVDKAGNLSTTASTHTFYVGAGGLSKPADGARTAGSFDVAAIVKDATAVQFQWRRGETDSWTNIAGQVAVSSGATTPFAWDAAAALGGDGTAQLRVSLIGGTANGTGTAPISVTVDQMASAAAEENVGPGSLDLLTGDYTLSASDASFFGVSLSRTARSRDPQHGTRIAGQVAPFGPAWATGAAAEVAGSDWSNVAVSGKAATLTAADGSKVAFTETNTGSGATRLWKPEIGAEDLTLTGTSTDGFTLRDSDGTLTTFTGGSGKLPVASSTPAGATGNETLYTWETVGTDKRLARIIAPTTAVAPLSNCGTGATPAAGCRVLQLNYASSGTAVPAAGTYGDYPNRVKSLTFWSMDPSTGTTVGTEVAAYAYDSNGRLAQAWDPRISPALKTLYGYDTDGRVISMTPPGERAWTFAYDTTGAIGSVNNGRLLSVTRDTLDTTNPTATTSIVYAVPVNSSGPVDLSAGVPGIGQTDLPVTATAIFPPDAVRTTHYGAQGPWAKATVHYLNVDGREVNTLTPGGGISTVEHDSFGNTIREMSATNLALAQSSSDPQLQQLGLSAASTAVRAQALSSTSVYDATGQRLLETFGPLHVVTLSDGTTVAARAHTVNVYDQGHPGGNKPRNLVTSTSVGARPAGATSDVDVRTTTTEYDWDLGLPTRTTVDPSGLNIATKTAYDTRGRVIRTDMPKAVQANSTTGADSTITTYYATGSNASACQKTAWEGLLCRTAPAGAITGGGSNPSALVTKTTTYNHLGQPVTLTETSGTTTRTTTTSYSEGRLDTVTISGSGIGTTVPTVVTGYSDTTGRVLTTTDTAPAPDVVITREYDALGRQTAYVDADGGRTETVYNWLGQVEKTKQFSNGATALETTYSYHADTKLLTGQVDPVAGTFSATYDLNGQLTGQGMPGGVSMTQTLDPTGSPLSRSYATTSAVLMAETISENIHGQWVTRNRADTDAPGTDQTYSYDANGRLTGVVDATSGCAVTRTYAFDRNSNRTSLTTAVSGECPAATAGTVDSTYDSADRLIATGYVYDDLGRSTSAPLPNGTATLTYYANDLIRRQTIGTQRQTWTLDPGMRLSSWTTETDSGGGTWSQTAAKINHYASDGDSPSWITEGGGAITRTVAGIGGDMAATTNATGNITLILATLHGDIGQQIALSNSTTINTSVPTVFRYADEYGNDKANIPDPDGNPTFNTARYGALGAKQRSTETIGSTLTLMGVRLYNPATGRFLSVDPVVGGNPNAYTYPVDPVNMYDLDGRRWCWKACGAVDFHNRMANYRIRAIRSVWNHASFGASYCMGPCIGFGFQGGNFSLNGGGIGLGGWGRVGGWNTARFSQQRVWSYSACASVGMGGCINGGVRKGSNRVWGGASVTGGAGFFAGIQINALSFGRDGFSIFGRRLF